MVDTVKVTMNLTAQDIENTDSLQKALNIRSKASAVSTALEVTRVLSELAGKDGKILIEHPSGDVERLVIPGLKSSRWSGLRSPK